MFNIAKRNLRIFFRNKSGVFFSFLSVIIIIGLYVLFLGDTVSSGVDVIEARKLSDSWIMAGVVAVCTVTATLGAFEVMVTDKESGKQKDFLVSPLSRRQFVGGYILSAAITGLILTLATLVLAEVYIIAYGGKVLSFVKFLQTFAVIMISVLSSGAFIFFIVTFIHNSGAFAGASITIGTMIGFLTGTYMPISILPASVAAFVKVFPPSHSAVLLRKIFMQTPLSVSFAGEAAAAAEYSKAMGASFYIGSFEITTALHIAYLIVSGAIFFALAILRLRNKNKRGKLY